MDMFDRQWREAKGLSLADVGEKILLGDYLLPFNAVFVAELRPRRSDSGILPTQADAELIITTDRVPTDLLARQYGLMTPELYGRYTVRVCVSDICAMGAQSAGLVITSALPVLHEASVRYGTDVGRCMREGYALGVPVVGGDTKWASDESRECYGRGFCAPWRCVAPHECVSGRSSVRNRPGWHCWRRALMVWLRHATLVNYILTTLRHSARRSSVRFLGLTWWMRVSARPLLFTACMDITDGLGQSLLEFGAASGVRLVMDAEALPLSRATLAVVKALGVDPMAIVGGIGLDLQLLVTTRSDVPVPSGLIRIGVVEAGEGVRLRNGAALDREFPISGFQHFRQRALDIALGHSI